MPLVVSFMQDAAIQSSAILAVGSVRATESLALGGMTTAAAEDGEWALISNTESAAIKVAHGSTPDSTATAGTTSTSAYYVVGAGQNLPIAVVTGDKFSASAI